MAERREREEASPKLSQFTAKRSCLPTGQGGGPKAEVNGLPEFRRPRWHSGGEAAILAGKNVREERALAVCRNLL